ncbi:hypothetical protein ABPG77_007807 [Micractinium sp. CCAP 211/92]
MPTCQSLIFAGPAAAARPRKCTGAALGSAPRLVVRSPWLHSTAHTAGAGSSTVSAGSKSSAGRGSSAIARVQADFVLVPWDASQETWDEESEARMKKLVARFEAADKDGNGVIDRDELRSLLERVGGGEDEVPTSWLTDDDVSEVLAQYDTNGDGVISFEEFVRMAQDKIFLAGKLEEYREAFRAVDAGGNGTISATELFQLFEKIGHPITYEKLVSVMEKYDVDQSGVIDFGEFLRMFRNELLDLNDILAYIKKRTAAKAAAVTAQGTRITVDQLTAASQGAAGSAATAAAAPPAASPAAPPGTGPKLLPGGVNLFFSEADLDAVLASNPGKLVVLMASVTWCRPCKGFQSTYEAAAKHYKDAVFLKFYGNSNEGTKELFKERLKCRTTPSFFFFRDGAIVGSCTGANAKRLETHLRQAYGEQGLEQAPLWLDQPADG